MRIIDCDVLVVGGGGAALRAALAAKAAGPTLKVVLATKGSLGKSGVTAISCSDRMAFHATLDHTEPGGADAWKYHADDIYRIGGKVSDHDLAEVLALGAKEAFHFLDRLGVPFAKKNGLADQFVTDGSDYARACYTGPKTANHIEEALVREFAGAAIDTCEFTAVHELIVAGGRVIGAVAVDTKEKEADKAIFAFRSPAVILATGGGGLIYEHNVFPGGMTGDGYAMAYEAGAELVNMEFIQLGIASTRTKFNCSGSMMRAIPRLVSDSGEEILAKYFPAGTSPAEIFNTLFKKGASWPVSYEHKTHIVDIALYKEWQSGRKVYLDYGKNPEGFDFDLLTADVQARYRSEMRTDLGEAARRGSPLARLQEINQASIDWFKERGVDIVGGDLIEVAACAQHFQGGVKIDAKARTTVKGLWAAGETAGGQHGANRPGGNALLDCQVFGKIAGEDAAKAAAQAKPADRELIEGKLAEFAAKVTVLAGGEIAAHELRKRLQAVMEAGASIIRTAEGLARGASDLAGLCQLKPRVDSHGLSFCLETMGMLSVAAMVLAAAAERDESRGPHLRFARFSENTPLPRRDPEWEKYIVVTKGDGGPALSVRTPQA
jgi:succinate dehydrogenase/fumarate reductase flavoprotein subunit